MSTTGTERSSEYTLNRGIDYLGSLTRTLRDLSGYASLVYELVQNADDAPGATDVRFESTPDALIVWNNGRFSDCRKQELGPNECPQLLEQDERCDFHRFRSVSAGDKGRHADVTGAFGIGFTAVYQITDAPEIISSGRHLFVDETKPEDGRIRGHDSCSVCDGEAGTKFILPWATDPDSAFRKSTEMPPVAPTDGDVLAEVLEDVLPTAMLFLRKIRRVTVSRAGRPDRHFVREDDGEDRLISDGERDRLWRVISATFDDEAEDLRARYPGRLEKSASVSLAIPFDDGVEGRLCAYLPTEERSGLPFHINADFFPASDRKRLLRERHQGEWNRAAIRRSAQLLAERLPALREVTGPRQLWSLLVDANGLLRDRDSAPLSLDAFWTELEPTLRSAPILLSSTEDWIAPSDAMVVREADEEPAAELLSQLGGRFAHSMLRESCFRLPYQSSLGMTQLGVTEVAELLLHAGISSRLEIPELPEALRGDSARAVVVEELERLIARSGEQARRNRESIASVALAPGIDGAVWPWGSAFRADEMTIAVFKRFAIGSTFLDPSRLPGAVPALQSMAPMFTARDALAWLLLAQESGMDELLSEASAALLEWFADRLSEFAADDDLRRELVGLPIFPSADGARPLSELALPGDFHDELGLASILDTLAIPSAMPLLRRLGVEPLTFDRYVTEFVPRATDLVETDPDRWMQLVLMLAEKLGQIEDDEEAHRALAPLPLIQTSDGSFVPADSAYIPSATLDDVLVVYTRASAPSDHLHAVHALYRWLGVAVEPRPLDVVARIRQLTAEPPGAARRDEVATIIEYLARVLEPSPPEAWGDLAALREMAWLPARGDEEEWYRASQVFTTFQDYLFASQARFLALSLGIQRRAARFLDNVGVHSTPSTGQIVAHLLHCSESGNRVNQQVYEALSQRADEPEIQHLRGTKCILLPNGAWVSPAFVFWRSHPFGRFRGTLGEEFQRFAPLLGRLDVRDEPAAQDAAEVLLELAREYGPSHTPIEEEDDVRVHAACWRMLDDALHSGSVDDSFFDQFQTRQVVLDSRQVLTEPGRVFFDDAPGLADRFPPELAASLVRRPEGGWRALRAAGVRDLSQAVAVKVLELKDPAPYEELATAIATRLPQLARALDPIDPGWVTYLDEATSALSVVSTMALVVAYSLPVFRVEAPPAEVDVLYISEASTLYVTRTNGDAWLAIGRELARAVAPEVPAGSLAANLALVLSAVDSEDADLQLDRASIPRLEHIPEGVAEANVVKGFGGDDVPDRQLVAASPTDRQPGPSADPSMPSQHPSASTLQAATRAHSVGRRLEDGEQQPFGEVTPVEPRLERRARRGQLRSYVVPADATDAGRDEPRDDGRGAVDRAGVAHVLDVERSDGRHPVEMPHENPGYDVESRDDEGNVERYIEVKSIGGDWDGYGVSVSPRQLAEARTLGSRYWLYVVSRATTGDWCVYRINDPASKISQYLFDDGWIAVSDERR